MFGVLESKTKGCFMSEAELDAEIVKAANSFMRRCPTIPAGYTITFGDAAAEVVPRADFDEAVQYLREVEADLRSYARCGYCRLVVYDIQFQHAQGCPLAAFLAKHGGGK